MKRETMALAQDIQGLKRNAPPRHELGRGDGDEISVRLTGRDVTVAGSAKSQAVARKRTCDRVRSGQRPALEIIVRAHLALGSANNRDEALPDFIPGSDRFFAVGWVEAPEPDLAGV